MNLNEFRTQYQLISHCESCALSENSARYDVTLYVTMFQKSQIIGSCALFSNRTRYDAISFSNSTASLRSSVRQFENLMTSYRALLLNNARLPMF